MTDKKGVKEGASGRLDKVGRTRKKAKPRSKKPEWDVIVIGTGMGGSAAGAITALHGLKTLVLEKNPRPGGTCSYYEKDGFHVDTGTHLFIRGNKGPFGVCTKRIGMGTPIKFIKTKMTTQLKGMNVDVTVPQSLAGRARILPILAWQAKISPVYYPAIMRLFWDIVMMKQEEIESLDTVSVEEFMFRYTDEPTIRTMIGMLLGLFFILPPWEASAGESVWNLQKLVAEDNLSYPKGGAVSIPKTFLQGAMKHGARVQLNAGVKKIMVSGGKVKGVVLENGERITSRAVISTTSLKDTVLKFTGPQYFPEPYMKKAEEIKPSWTAVQAKIALKKKLVKAGSLVGGTPLKFKDKFTDTFAHEVIGKLERGILGDMIPIYAPVPSNYDPDLAPRGCQLITAVAVAPTLDVELQDQPSVWIDGMMDALYQLVPGLRKNIIFCDTWSVEALAGWIGKSNGSAITTSQTPNQVGVNRPSHHTPVKGLYIAGDCGGSARGVGTELACESGMDCGGLVAR